MSKPKSSRHHYIPKFFIKSFCTPEGYLYVYNKQKDKIDKRRNYPKSVFYRHNLNCATEGGNRHDIIEDMYAGIDDHLATQLRIHSRWENDSLEKEEMQWKIIRISLIANLRMRGIKYRSKVVNIEPSQFKNRIGLQLSDNSTGKDRTSDIWKLYEQSQTLQFTFPAILEQDLLFDTNQGFEVCMRMLRFRRLAFPMMIADDPIITDEDFDHAKIPRFLFALGSDEFILNVPGLRRVVIPKTFGPQIALATIENAETLVGCHDLTYLKLAVDWYRNANAVGSKNQHRSRLFTRLLKL